MNKMTKTGLISLAVAATMAMAPQVAFAHKAKKAHTHKKAAATHHHAAAAPSASSSSDARFRQLEAEIQALRSELGRTRSETKSAVASVSEKAAAQDAALDAKLIEHEKKTAHNDLLFFRGGFASQTHPRQNEAFVSNAGVQSALIGAHLGDPYYEKNQGNGWYIGAGFDHVLTDNVWGLTDAVSVDGEVMFEYKNFGLTNSTAVNLITLGSGVDLGKPTAVAQSIKAQVTQITIGASPKIKFNGLGDFRPWIIPAGLSINVISPPSSGGTYITPGLLLGVGGEYRIWESLWAGVDFRYNFTGGDINYTSNKGLLKSTSADGLTAGGYLGFGF